MAGVSSYSPIASADGDERLYAVDDPTGTPADAYITVDVINAAQNADDVSITDSGTYFTGTDVEAALQEVGSDLAAIDGTLTSDVVLVADTDASGYGFVVDEDDMSSDSATKLPTQQSVKAYVDAEVAAASPVPTKNTVGATGATETLTTDDVQHMTMDQNCTFTFPTLSDAVHVMTVHLFGAFTPTWPGSVTWVGGYEPTYSSGNIYLFFTDDTGTNWYGSLYGGFPTTQPFEITVACSDESTAIDSTGTKLTFRMPFAGTLTGVRASLNSAASTGTFTVDINESGTTVLSTKLTIDATEKTSTTASAAAVISDSALADDAEITIDVDNTGDDTATGLKVTLLGERAV